MNIIAIDIGGTMIKYGLVTKSGSILEHGEIDTEANLGLNNILIKIDKIFNDYANISNNKYNAKILGIAVSGTGQINSKEGKVIGGNDIIPNWIGTNLVKILEDKYKLPAILENDVNCASIGEKWLGAGRNKKNFICLTIGTGIGGGIVLNDELFTGENYVAGEFGHIKIRKVKEYEQLASMTALVNKVYEITNKKLNGLEIFNLEKQSIDPYTEIVKDWIEAITDGLSSIIYIFNPSCIILGGGVTKQGEYFLNKINKSLENKIGINFQKNLEIKVAELENNAGMLGATYLLLQKLNEI